jgi:hypothetical protein
MELCRWWPLLAALVAGCSANVAPGTGEGQSEAECSDGIDNDGNGFSDCQEAACADKLACKAGGGDATAGYLDGGGGPPPKTWPTCASTVGEAKQIASGVDIIWFIDTSGSMSQETAWVQQNLNDFAQFIGGKQLDYHVILVGASSICVAPPLGGASCSDGPRYRHVKQTVGSTDGLTKLISTYPQWQSFLRADASKNFIAVTDDNSSKPASWFQAELAKLTNPGFPGGFVFHSIVAYGPLPTKGCDTGARIGQVYLDLTAATKGSQFQICLKDWKPIFSQLAQSVAATAKPPCSYAIPAPPAGQEINPTQVQLTYEVGGTKQTLPQAANAAACGAGFYYDDPAKPTTVTLCPDTCKALSGGKVVVEFGCSKGID